MYTYLLIDLLSMAIPVAFSFDKRLGIRRNWKALIPAILLPAVFFMVWDVLFTEMGVWGFESRYLVGIEFFGLPLEEVLFFIAIPYSCLFTYEVVCYYFKESQASAWSRKFTLVLLIVAGLTALFVFDRLYTFYTAAFLVVFVGFHFIRQQAYLGKMLIAYGFILIPFFIVNGILTGTGLDVPIVWYDDSQNLGLRIGTVPVEDLFYGFLLIGSNITLYEHFKP